MGCHNICFHGEISKIIFVAMALVVSLDTI